MWLMGMIVVARVVTTCLAQLGAARPLRWSGRVSPSSRVFEVPSVASASPIGGPNRPNIPRTSAAFTVYPKLGLAAYPGSVGGARVVGVGSGGHCAVPLQYLWFGFQLHGPTQHWGPWLPA